MFSAALEAALADIDTIFDGFSSPNETGCGRCHLPEETAYLRTPYTRVPPDVLERFLFEVRDHFDDHPAAMRRLLPQGARALADGTLAARVGWEPLGLSEVDWRRWPAEQAAAVEAFVHAWWEDNLAKARPPQPVAGVFEACVALLGTVVPLLDRWPAGPEADAHLARCVDSWIDDLLLDSPPFSRLDPDIESTVVRDLQTWLAAEAPARIEPLDYGLAVRAGVLGLPAPERWDRLP
ncbi:hypothetical protein [Streptomyces europaeiscabiei]|uniref:hypothetical protein n=1 Tax=Streptomyces europaeiscabiei TaxID=146819 RepID=UPI0029A086DA|nr:hypothetical protein [Streptomyces europaeiscabiei]MDX3583660.1 hypothetical protein [Streptomyces europaeiscabiei]